MSSLNLTPSECGVSEPPHSNRTRALRMQSFGPAMGARPLLGKCRGGAFGEHGALAAAVDS